MLKKPILADTKTAVAGAPVDISFRGLPATKPNPKTFPMVTALHVGYGYAFDPGSGQGAATELTPVQIIALFKSFLLGYSGKQRHRSTTLAALLNRLRHSEVLSPFVVENFQPLEAKALSGNTSIGPHEFSIILAPDFYDPSKVGLPLEDRLRGAAHMSELRENGNMSIETNATNGVTGTISGLTFQVWLDVFEADRAVEQVFVEELEEASSEPTFVINPIEGRATRIDEVFVMDDALSDLTLPTGYQIRIDGENTTGNPLSGNVTNVFGELCRRDRTNGTGAVLLP